MSRQAQTDTGRVLAELRESGISTVPGVFSRAECDHYITGLEGVLQERLASGEYCGNQRYQVLYNYFQRRPEYFSLLHQDITDAILSEVIDDDYVLLSPTARNRQIRQEMPVDAPTSGVGWHIDSRGVGTTNRLFDPTPMYFAIVALEELRADNGATQYIPGSHRWFRRPDDRNATLESVVLEAEPGSVTLLDSALWHRVGEPSERSRWTVFNLFGPWFMKPYYRFNEMFPPAEMESFPPRIRQLLHWDSTPPRDHTESTVTLRRVRAQFASPPR